ncbi:hypothetical protein Tco_1486759, partial [Tanacetum coccineum]
KPGHLAIRLGCAETKVATWDDLAFKLINLHTKVATWDDLAFKLINLRWNVKHSTDIAKIPRKRSKPGKHEHGNKKSTQRAGSNSSSKVQHGRIKRHPSPLIGGNPRREDTWISEVTQGNGYFALILLSKEAQSSLTHGCHVGNPCVPKFNLTVDTRDPMMSKVGWTRLEERLTNSGS